MVIGERLLDLINLAMRCLCAGQAGQNRAGLVRRALGHEETRAFRNEQERNKEERGGQEFHPEHPAPGFKTEQPFIHRRSACGLSDEVVRHEGQEEAADDRDLLDRGETTAILRRRNLGDIGGRHDAGRADGETANDAIDNEFR